jgi:hypothetical protein
VNENLGEGREMETLARTRGLLVGAILMLAMITLIIINPGG